MGSNSASEHARDMELAAKPMFCGMWNHLGPFSEASDQPQGQELGGWVVMIFEIKIKSLSSPEPCL